MLENGLPPVYYLPPADVDKSQLQKSSSTTFCPWKGTASYYDAPGNPKIAWYYPQPIKENFKPLAGYICFYPSKVDKATVDGEVVKPQPSDFYGGWITSNIVGPYK